MKDFENAARYYPKFGNINHSKLISDISTPALKEVGDAIKVRDSDVFSRAFTKLTATCNDILPIHQSIFCPTAKVRAIQNRRNGRKIECFYSYLVRPRRHRLKNLACQIV